MVGVNFLGEMRKAERMFIADVTADGLDGEVNTSSSSHFLKCTEYVYHEALASMGRHVEPEVILVYHHRSSSRTNQFDLPAVS